MMAAMNLQQQGVSLRKLLDGLVEVPVADATVVYGLCLDSRKRRIGDLFCARSGSRLHAACFIPQAVEAGAAAVLVEAGQQLDLLEINIPVFQVGDFNQVIGEVAARFFGRPSEQVPVTGITGTNGKTSITWLLAHAMSDAGRATGMIGTLGIGMPDNLKESVNTTPDAITVHGGIAALAAQGAQTVVMEVSSHALAQERVAGVRFEQAIFTNLSREHLDYHSSMQAYADAKRRLFTDYPVTHRILNLDDPSGHEIWRQLCRDDSVYGFSLRKADAEYPQRCIIGRILSDDLYGLTLAVDTPWGAAELKSGLSGNFNAANLLAALTSMCLYGLPLAGAIQRLSACPPVPGRMEKFGGTDNPLVIVDYAHTPDALDNALRSLKPLVRGKLICVFGCGGDRDAGKRPEMGRIAEQYADDIILTNDNPRGEDPEAIIRDILGGIERQQHIAIEPDRSSAITTAIRQAGPEDVVLVAGKGHESSQLIKGKYHPFSDRSLVRACLEVW